MTVRRNQSWGAAARLPETAPIAGSNAELRQLVTHQRAGDVPPMPIGVIGGDLWHVVGAPSGGAARLRSEQARTAPIDLIEVTADGETHWACIGAVARNSWWHGPVIAAMNAEMLGRWRLAPAAHPNDGRVHVLSTGVGQSGLGVAQRVLAGGCVRARTCRIRPSQYGVSRAGSIDSIGRSDCGSTASEPADAGSWPARSGRTLRWSCSEQTGFDLVS